MNPPNAGERKRLPKIATHGLQIVSPSGGWLLAGCARGGAVVEGGITEGNGGGPAAGTGINEGNGGGVDRGGAAFGSASADGSLAGVEEPLSVGAALEAAADVRNSEIGFQEDFASSHARSVGLKLPAAIFSRMADSEKRPANCPFR